jgi:broad-specificity NMP kinase
VFTVLITGPPGVGKTSVLTALVDARTDDDVWKPNAPEPT